MESGFGVVNWVVLLVYFAAMIYLGSSVGKSNNSTEGFFLGNRKIPWWDRRANRRQREERQRQLRRNHRGRSLHQQFPVENAAKTAVATGGVMLESRPK